MKLFITAKQEYLNKILWVLVFLLPCGSMVIASQFTQLSGNNRVANSQMSSVNNMQRSSGTAISTAPTSGWSCLQQNRMSARASSGIYSTSGKRLNSYSSGSIGYGVGGSARSSKSNPYVGVQGGVGSVGMSYNSVLPRTITSRKSANILEELTLSKRRIYVKGESEEDGDKYWDEDEGEWLPIPGTGDQHSVGDKRTNPETGEVEMWNGTEWVKYNSGGSEVNLTPLGDMPWLLLTLLMLTKITRLTRLTRETSKTNNKSRTQLFR